MVFDFARDNGFRLQKIPIAYLLHAETIGRDFYEQGAGRLILRFILSWAILCAGLAGHVVGQTESVLNSFGAANLGTQPTGTLIEGPDGNFYGMTVQGGTYSKGTLSSSFPSCTWERTCPRSFAASAKGRRPAGN